jgi:hypothetical protein
MIYQYLQCVTPRISYSRTNASYSTHTASVILRNISWSCFRPSIFPEISTCERAAIPMALFWRANQACRMICSDVILSCGCSGSNGGSGTPIRGGWFAVPLKMACFRPRINASKRWLLHVVDQTHGGSSHENGWKHFGGSSIRQRILATLVLSSGACSGAILTPPVMVDRLGVGCSQSCCWRRWCSESLTFSNCN